MEFTQHDLDRLVVAQAMQKVVGDIVSTKDPCSLRAAADRHFAALYDETGAKSFDLKHNGEKVGTYSVRIAKAKAVDEIEVVDMAACVAWAIENGFATIDMDAAARHFAATGEVPDGATVARRETQERVSGGSIRIDNQKVLEVYGDSVRVLLGGGLDED